MNIKVHIEIVLNDSGQIFVKSSSQNNLLNLGMLSAATFIIGQQLKPQEPSPIVIPENGNRL